MIHVRQVTKRFGGFSAVRGISFDAPDGAITGLLGANGAGKTTTLRMMVGVLTADSGEIEVNGASLPGDPAAAQRGLGALLDHTALYPRLTARENLAYFAKLRGMRGPLLESRIGSVLDELGLGELADRRTGGFSQGECTKVALGRALIHRPAHVVLDEPTNGLDLPTVRLLRRLLTHLRDAGACIVFSSHVLGEVEGLCDRVVVIARGAVAAQGSIEELRNLTRSSSLEDAFVKLTEGSEQAA